ncbi:phenylacetate--CoA ligase family protein [Desertimonas flava]|uniref:phenylacetate--CoA ligase family protein n=1 Tax=Desertimonas flava TaxID=2064846 RepID=UPI001969343B|nr:AMP-binding protein [Desertimonas flava]
MAARSPFYREWFKTSGVDPRDIRTLADLEQLPLLTRRHLVERPDDFRVYPRRVMWPSRSSGTSGAPVTVYRTQGSSIYELAALRRQWRWFGLPSSARRVVLRGSDFASDQGGYPTKLIPGANQLMVSSFQLTPANLDQILDDIRAFEPHAIEGWPSSMNVLAKLLLERSTHLPVRAVITSSEVMTPGQRNLLRSVFDGPIVDHYGQTERVALAGVCEAGSMHIFSDYGIVELLPVDGSSNRREIVGTALHNWGFPLLRYRTGDEVVSAPSSACVCGRAFPLLGDIDGRIEDTFSTADGRPLPLPGTAVDDLAGVHEAQIAQLAPGRFEVRVSPGVGFDEKAVSVQIRENVDRLFGEGHELTIRVVDELKRPPSGKLKSAVVESR